MIAQLGSSQPQDGGGKEHCFIVWMCYQKAYPLISQLGESRARNGHCVEPADYHDNWDSGNGDPLHGCAVIVGDGTIEARED